MLSFFRKLSIGGKIKDGILPERIMETAEDLSIAKDQSALTLKTDTELRESVYGKLRTICVLCRSSIYWILFVVGKMARHCEWRSLYILVQTFCTVIDRYPHNKYHWIDRVSLNRQFRRFKRVGCFSDLLRTIKDPEKPQTLEQLDVVYEDCVSICHCTPGGISVIRVEFNPTVPHCSLATLIGLCIRVKLERHLAALFKLDIYIKEGAHSTEEESTYVCHMYFTKLPSSKTHVESPSLKLSASNCSKQADQWQGTYSSCDGKSKLTGTGGEVYIRGGLLAFRVYTIVRCVCCWVF